MTYKQLKLSAVLLLGLGLTGIQAQTMYVNENSGTQTAYALSNMRKMTFSGGNANVQKTDNTTGVYALSELQYLIFQGLPLVIEQPVKHSASNLIIYPNPVTDILNIVLTGVTTEGTISIFTLEGKVLLEQKTDGANTVTLNLSQLPQGMYLCRYTSTTENITVQIIKQ